MPQKSKKEKILAEARRKILIEKQLSYNFVKPQTENHELSASQAENAEKQAQKYTAKSIQTDVSLLEHKYLRGDLLRILIFTVAAVISQVVLYYFLRG